MDERERRPTVGHAVTPGSYIVHEVIYIGESELIARCGKYIPRAELITELHPTIPATQRMCRACPAFPDLYRL